MRRLVVVFAVLAFFPGQSAFAQQAALEAVGSPVPPIIPTEPPAPTPTPFLPSPTPTPVPPTPTPFPTPEPTIAQCYGDTTPYTRPEDGVGVCTKCHQGGSKCSPSSSCCHYPQNVGLDENGKPPLPVACRFRTNGATVDCFKYTDAGSPKPSLCYVSYPNQVTLECKYEYGSKAAKNADGKKKANQCQARTDVKYTCRPKSESPSGTRKGPRCRPHPTKKKFMVCPIRPSTYQTGGHRQNSRLYKVPRIQPAP